MPIWIEFFLLAIVLGLIMYGFSFVLMWIIEKVMDE